MAQPCGLTQEQLDRNMLVAFLVLVGGLLAVVLVALFFFGDPMPTGIACLVSED